MGISWFQALIFSTLVSFSISYRSASTMWINEFHYQMAGTDENEFIEVAAEAGTNLMGRTIVLYSGSPHSRKVYETIPLSGIVEDQENGYGFKSFKPFRLLRDGPDGIALVYENGTVAEFLSYEGTLVALDGPAVGLQSTNVNIRQEWANDPQYSLQKVGTGNRANDFTWVLKRHTNGTVNTNQIINPQPGNTTSVSPAMSTSPLVSPTASPSISRTPSVLASKSASVSSTVTASSSQISTPSVSHTPSIVPSISTSATPSVSESSSTTPTGSNSPTPTISITPTQTASKSVSLTPTTSKSATPSSSFSATPSVSESFTPSISVFVSPSSTPSESSTPTISLSPTSSVSKSQTPSPSISYSSSITATPTGTLSPSVSISSSPSYSNSPTASATKSESATPTISSIVSTTPTSSGSATPSATETPTRTPSVSPSVTPTSSATSSASLSPTPSETAAPSGVLNQGIPQPTITPCQLMYGINDTIVSSIPPMCKNLKIDLSGTGFSIGDKVRIVDVMSAGDLNYDTEVFHLKINGQVNLRDLQSGVQCAVLLEPNRFVIDEEVTVKSIENGIPGFSVDIVSINSQVGVFCPFRFKIVIDEPEET